MNLRQLTSTCESVGPVASRPQNVCNVEQLSGLLSTQHLNPYSNSVLFLLLPLCYWIEYLDFLKCLHNLIFSNRPSRRGFSGLYLNPPLSRKNFQEFLFCAPINLTPSQNPQPSLSFYSRLPSAQSFSLIFSLSTFLIMIPMMEFACAIIIYISLPWREGERERKRERKKERKKERNIVVRQQS